jgi:hypothetical protein
MPPSERIRPPGAVTKPKTIAVRIIYAPGDTPGLGERERKNVSKHSDRPMAFAVEPGTVDVEPTGKVVQAGGNPRSTYSQVVNDSFTNGGQARSRFYISCARAA